MLPALVVPLSNFLERQKQKEEIFLESLGLSLARGSLIEIIGPASSGKSSLVLSILAKLTSGGEVCAVVDGTGGFNPYAAVSSGAVLQNLLWIKGDSSIEKTLKAASLVAQGKGFGAIWLNLSGFDAQTLRHIPNTYWYRFRNLVKDTPTLFLVTAPEPIVGPATSRSYLLGRKKTRWSGKARFKLLREFELEFTSRKHCPEERSFKFDFSYDNA